LVELAPNCRNMQARILQVAVSTISAKLAWG
jgi:hypothetical protein